MKRAALFGVLSLSIGFGIACGGRSDAERDGDDNDFSIAGSSPIIKTGCLTSAGDRYVLTALEGGGGAATELYQLVGEEDELRSLVGREVRVTGDAEPGQVAQINEPSQSTPVGTSGAGSGNQAQVTTQAETRIETRKLRVATVAATGGECAEAVATQ